MKLGKVIQVNLNLVDSINNWNFDSLNSDEVATKIGIKNAAIYLDKKTSQMFITLDVEDFKVYQKLSVENSNSWWAKLEPLSDLENNQSLLDYAWHEIFKIEDDE